MDIIDEFNKIRDIPYRIPLSLDEPNDCCTGKAERLCKILKDNGYEVRFRICTFKWKDLNIPAELQNIPHDDNSSHIYCEINLQGTWIIMDATWDQQLRGLYPINEWNGKSDTTIAVPAGEIFSPAKSLDYYQHTSSPEAVIADLKLNGAFYQAFNEYLETYRQAERPINPTT